MATVKVKFRASSVATKEGTLFYQVIHKRIVRQIHTGYKLFPAEWDAVHSEVVLSSVTSESRRDYLLSLKNSLLEDSVRLKNIITRLERSGIAYTSGSPIWPGWLPGLKRGPPGAAVPGGPVPAAVHRGT